jgi:hypothetical protein
MNGCKALQLPGRVEVALSGQAFHKTSERTDWPNQFQTLQTTVSPSCASDSCTQRVFDDGFSLCFYSQQLFPSVFSTVLFIGRQVLKAILTWCQFLVTPAGRVADLCITVDETH